MLTPFKADNLVEFTLEPQGGTTRVTWAMSGRVPYVAKVAHMFFDMDTMVGRDFEAGLAKLKTVTER
jgi:carbon monoxide dehydrogenase subunit G